MGCADVSVSIDTADYTDAENVLIQFIQQISYPEESTVCKNLYGRSLSSIDNNFRNTTTLYYVDKQNV